jgi:hypothetical protein
MPKYTAELYRSAREVLYHEFEADNDEAAREYIVKNTEKYRIDWIACEDSDASDGGTEDCLIDLRPSSGSGKHQEGIRLKSEMPYSWDAREFVKKVATMAFPKSCVEALTDLKLEARKICGMEEAKRADFAWEKLKDIPPHVLLPALAKHMEKHGQRDLAKELRAFMWRAILRKLSFGLLGRGL